MNEEDKKDLEICADEKTIFENYVLAKVVSELGEERSKKGVKILMIFKKYGVGFVTASKIVKEMINILDEDETDVDRSIGNV